MDIIVAILIAVATAVLGVVGGYLYRKQAGEKKIGRTEEYAKNLLEDAQRKADEKKKETILEAKEEVLRLKTELDRECRERRAEVQRSAASFSARKVSIKSRTLWKAAKKPFPSGPESFSICRRSLTRASKSNLPSWSASRA